METAHFSIPLLCEERQALDLANALIAVKGVADAESDVQQHVMSVVYDIDYTSPATLKGLIENAGYPVGDEQ